MRRTLVLAFFFSLGVSVFARAEDKDAKTLAQEILDKGAALFDKRDAAAMAATYTEDAQLEWIEKDSAAGGIKIDVKKGREEIETVYRDLFKDAKEATTSKNTVEYARFVGSELLVIEGDFQPNVASEGKLPLRADALEAGRQVAHEEPTTLRDRQRLSIKLELQGPQGRNRVATGKRERRPRGEMLGYVAITVVDDARRGLCDGAPVFALAPGEHWDHPAKAGEALVQKRDAGPRVPWNGSRFAGTPDPPPPFAVAPAFPRLKFDFPVVLVAAAGTSRLFVGELKGRIYSFPNDPACRTRRSRNRPDEAASRLLRALRTDISPSL